MDLQGKGDLMGAMTEWQQALELEPTDARANNGMGIALGMAGKSAEAVPYFQKAVQAQADFFEAYYNLAVLYTKQKQADSAIGAWQNVVRIRPKFAQGHESLGSALYVKGDFSNALRELRSAIEEEPNRVVSLRLASNLLATCPDSSLRNGTEAVALADRARQLTNGKDPAVLDTLSAAYAEKGSFAQAIDTEEQAVDLATQEGDVALAGRLKVHLARYESNEPLREGAARASF